MRWCAALRTRLLASPKCSSSYLHSYVRVEYRIRGFSDTHYENIQITIQTIKSISYWIIAKCVDNNNRNYCLCEQWWNCAEPHFEYFLHTRRVLKRIFYSYKGPPFGGKCSIWGFTNRIDLMFVEIFEYHILIKHYIEQILYELQIRTIWQNLLYISW